MEKKEENVPSSCFKRTDKADNDCKWTEELELQFYDYCKKIILTVMQPMMLILYNSPPTLMNESRSLDVDNVSTNNDASTVYSSPCSNINQNDQQKVHSSVRLLDELKRIDNDLRELKQIQYRLFKNREKPTMNQLANSSSIDVSSLVQNICDEMTSIQTIISGTVEEGATKDRLLAAVNSNIKHVNNLSRKLDDFKCREEQSNRTSEDNGKCILNKKVISMDSLQFSLDSESSVKSKVLAGEQRAPFGKNNSCNQPESVINRLKISNQEPQPSFNLQNEDDKQEVKNTSTNPMRDSGLMHRSSNYSRTKFQAETSLPNRPNKTSDSAQKVNNDNVSEEINTNNNQCNAPVTSESSKSSELNQLSGNINKSNTSHVDFSKYEQEKFGSKFLILETVDSKYKQIAQKVLENTIKSDEINTLNEPRTIGNVSNDSKLSIKLTYQPAVEKAAEYLLTEKFKGMTLENFFDFKNMPQIVNAGKIMKLCDEDDPGKSQSNIFVSEKYNNSLEDVESVGNELNCAFQEKAHKSRLGQFVRQNSQLSTKTSDLSVGQSLMQEFEKNILQDPTTHENSCFVKPTLIGDMEHHWEIVKMLRSLIDSMKNTVYSLNVSSPQDFSSVCTQSTNKENITTIPVVRPSTFNILLEELFKKILLHFYEKKEQAEVEALSDESFNQFLYDIQDRETMSNQPSFSNDTFEEFSSNLPCMKKKPLTTVKKPNIGSGSSKKTSVENILLIAELSSIKSDDKSESLDSDGSLHRKSTDEQSTDLLTNSEKSTEQKVASDPSIQPQFKNQNLSNYEIEMDENKSSKICRLDALGPQVFNNSSEQFKKITRKVALNKLVNAPKNPFSDEKESCATFRKFITESLSSSKDILKKETAENGVSTEQVEEEIDFNEQIKVLGRKIADTEDELEEFENQEPYCLGNNEIMRFGNSAYSTTNLCENPIVPIRLIGHNRVRNQSDSFGKCTKVTGEFQRENSFITLSNNKCSSKQLHSRCAENEYLFQPQARSRPVNVISSESIDIDERNKESKNKMNRHKEEGSKSVCDISCGEYEFEGSEYLGSNFINKIKKEVFTYGNNSSVKEYENSSNNEGAPFFNGVPQVVESSHGLAEYIRSDYDMSSVSSSESINSNDEKSIFTTSDKDVCENFSFYAPDSEISTSRNFSETTLHLDKVEKMKHEPSVGERSKQQCIIHEGNIVTAQNCYNIENDMRINPSISINRLHTPSSISPKYSYIDLTKNITYSCKTSEPVTGLNEDSQEKGTPDALFYDTFEKIEQKHSSNISHERKSLKTFNTLNHTFIKKTKSRASSLGAHHAHELKSCLNSDSKEQNNIRMIRPKLVLNEYKNSLIFSNDDQSPSKSPTSQNAINVAVVSKNLIHTPFDIKVKTASADLQYHIDTLDNAFSKYSSDSLSKFHYDHDQATSVLKNDQTFRNFITKNKSETFSGDSKTSKRFSFNSTSGPRKIKGKLLPAVRSFISPVEDEIKVKSDTDYVISASSLSSRAFQTHGYKVLEMFSSQSICDDYRNPSNYNTEEFKSSVLALESNFCTSPIISPHDYHTTSEGVNFNHFTYSSRARAKNSHKKKAAVEKKICSTENIIPVHTSEILLDVQEVLKESSRSKVLIPPIRSIGSQTSDLDFTVNEACSEIEEQTTLYEELPDSEHRVSKNPPALSISSPFFRLNGLSYSESDFDEESAQNLNLNSSSTSYFSAFSDVFYDVLNEGKNRKFIKLEIHDPHTRSRVSPCESIVKQRRMRTGDDSPIRKHKKDESIRNDTVKKKNRKTKGVVTMNNQSEHPSFDPIKTNNLRTKQGVFNAPNSNAKHVSTTEKHPRMKSNNFKKQIFCPKHDAATATERIRRTSPVKKQDFVYDRRDYLKRQNQLYEEGCVLRNGLLRKPKLVIRPEFIKKENNILKEEIILQKIPVDEETFKKRETFFIENRPNDKECLKKTKNIYKLGTCSKNDLVLQCINNNERRIDHKEESCDKSALEQDANNLEAIREHQLCKKKLGKLGILCKVEAMNRLSLHRRQFNNVKSKESVDRNGEVDQLDHNFSKQRVIECSTDLRKLNQYLGLENKSELNINKKKNNKWSERIEKMDMIRDQTVGNNGEKVDCLQGKDAKLSVSESKLSKRTFRSDGDSIMSSNLNSGTLMDFFEKVYCVYDHIRQCSSCKALMNQIIEEFMNDLARIRG